MKQQQLLFDKGMTNVPSDAICSDNALEDAVGMIYSDGEHRVIQSPRHKTSLGSGYRLLLVHHLPTNEKNYIVTDGTKLFWRPESGSSYAQLDITITSGITSNQIAVIGRTVIVATSSGLRYAVWQGSTYRTFGRIPAPHYNFFLVHSESHDRVSNFKEGSFFNTNSQNTAIIAEDHKEEYNNAIVGAYAENKKDIARRKGFCEPFFVRMAVELYDGSYTHISQPILMLPSMIENSYCTSLDVGDETDNFTLITQFSKLWFRPSTSTNPFTGMEEIVKGIAVFISDGIDIYDTNNMQTLEVVGASERWAYDGVWRTIPQGDDAVKRKMESGNIMCHMLKNRPYSEIVKDLQSTSVFYKIATIDPYAYSSTGNNYRLSDLFETHALENLTTQESLKYDDYHSFAELSAKTIYEYNSRINIAGLARSFFEGFDQFAQIKKDGSDTYYIVVRIKGEDGIYYSRKRVNAPFSPLWWFYYPDPRADWVTVFQDSGTNISAVLDTKLTSHEGLNGAYYFRGIPASDKNNSPLYNNPQITNPSGTLPFNPVTSRKESLPNQIATSEVNVPWIFNASGYNAIGNGEVLAMSTLTRALSQGQFGTYPLLVFCTDGIWAMSVDRTGLFTNIVPMSREVCNNTKCIVQTDGAIFFSSAKGLMVVGDGVVKCVSEQLSGRVSGRDISETSLASYMRGSNAFMAYDYRDSLLWIFNSGSGFEEYCYVFSMKSGTFAKYRFDYPIIGVCNDYPDTLLQVGNANCDILSFSGRPDINAELDRVYDAKLVSRPLKLENGLSLKSILQMRHIHTLSSSSSLSVKIEASNNLQLWTQLLSLHGTPWKYYRLTYTFSGMKSTDTFSGTVLITEERRNEKLR